MFKLRELIHSRRPAAAAAALLFTALLFYAGARMLPAIADERLRGKTASSARSTAWRRAYIRRP